MLKTNLHHCSTWKSQNGQYTNRPDMNNWKWLVVTKMTFLRSTKVNIFSIAMWKCYANSRHGTAVITAAHGGEVPKMASQFLSRNKKRWRYATPYLILFAARPSKLYNTNKNYFYSCYIAEAIGLYACARWPPHHMTAVRPCPPCLCSNSEFRVYRYSVIVWSLFHSCLNLCYFILSGSEFL